MSIVMTSESCWDPVGGRVPHSGLGTVLVDPTTRTFGSGDRVPHSGLGIVLVYVDPTTRTFGSGIRRSTETRDAYMIRKNKSCYIKTDPLAGRATTSGIVTAERKNATESLLIWTM